MQSLTDLVRAQRGLSSNLAVGWCVRLCREVMALHRLGVAHGALSSDCLLVAGADPKTAGELLDTRRAQPSLAHFSPERLATDVVSMADDVWAITVTLYFALTGQRPFEASNAPEMLKQIRSVPPAPLMASNVHDPGLQEVMDDFLQPNVGARATRVERLLEILEQLYGAANAAALPALGPGGVDPHTEPVFDDDDDDDVLTVMRDSSELLKDLNQVSPGLSAPDADTEALSDEDWDEGGATVMRSSPLAELSPLLDDDDDDDAATLMVDGLDAGLLSQLAEAEKARGPSPSASARAAAPPTAARASASAGLPGWSSSAPRPQRGAQAGPASASVQIAPRVAKAPSKTPVPSGSRPASRALPTQQVAAVVVPEGRQVLLKRLLVVALVVLALLVLLIVWLLLKRKGLV